MGELTGQSTVRQRPGSTSIGGAARTPEFSNGSTGSDAPWWSSPVVVAVVLLAGLALRIFAAFRFPFEQDELYTFLESRDLFHTGLAPGIDTRPLYYLIQHPLLGAVPTPLSLRWLPLLFGALGLWATWQIGRRYFGAAGGVVAAILVAVSPWHLYASSMARYYSLVYLCAALVVLWLPGAYESDEPKDYLRLLAVFIVGTLTHPSFVFAMVGLVAGLSLVRNDARFGLRWPSVKAWTYLWGPYAAALVIEFLMVHFFGRRGSIGNLGSRGIAATLRLVPAMVDWMTLPVFIGACVGALLMTFRRSENRRIGVIAIASTIGAMVLLVGASFRTGVYADYGIGILPLLFLCVTALSSELASPIERGRANLVLLALVVGSERPRSCRSCPTDCVSTIDPRIEQSRRKIPRASSLAGRKFCGASTRLICAATSSSRIPRISMESCSESSTCGLWCRRSDTASSRTMRVRSRDGWPRIAISRTALLVHGSITGSIESISTSAARHPPPRRRRLARARRRAVTASSTAARV